MTPRKTAPVHTIKFSKEYRKLDAPVFSTIRRRDKYPEPDTLIQIKTPTRRFYAFILAKQRLKTREISTALLTYDTDTVDRFNALKVLDSFYKNKITDDEPLTLIWLRRHHTGLEEYKVNDLWLGANQARLDCIDCKARLEKKYSPGDVELICAACLKMQRKFTP